MIIPGSFVLNSGLMSLSHFPNKQCSSNCQSMAQNTPKRATGTHKGGQRGSQHLSRCSQESHTDAKTIPERKGRERKGFAVLYVYIYIYIYLFIYLFIYSQCPDPPTIERPLLVTIMVCVSQRFCCSYKIIVIFCLPIFDGGHHRTTLPRIMQALCAGLLPHTRCKLGEVKQSKGRINILPLRQVLYPHAKSLNCDRC